MITEKDLVEAIAECEGQRNPNANTCMKLASFYTILDHIHKGEDDNGAGYSNDNNYAESEDYDYSIIEKWNTPLDRYLEVTDELLETLRIVNPRLFESVIRKFTE